MDTQELDRLIDQLCSEDFMEHSLAKKQLTHVLTPAALLQGAHDSSLLLKMMRRAATAPTTPAMARLFAAQLLCNCADADPVAFADSLLFSDVCLPMVCSEDLGVAEKAAVAIAKATLATDDTRVAHLLRARPADGNRTDAVLRVATACVDVESPTGPSPLSAGNVAAILGELLAEALKSSDVLLLANLAATCIASTRSCGARRAFNDATLLQLNEIIRGAQSAPPELCVVRPFVVKAAAAVVQNDASPEQENTVTAFGPSLVDFVSAGPPSDIEEYDLWAVAVGSLLASSRGSHMLEARLSWSRIAESISQSLRHGTSGKKQAALHIALAAARCPNLNARTAVWSVPDVWVGIMREASADAPLLRASCWAALSAALRMSLSTAGILVTLASIAALLCRAFTVALQQPPAPPSFFGDASSHEAIMDGAAALLALQFVVPPSDASLSQDQQAALHEAFAELRRVAADAGIEVGEAAL